MTTTHSTTITILACILVIGNIHAKENHGTAAVVPEAGEQTTEATRVNEKEKAKLADLMNVSDMIVVGRLVRPAATCVTVSSGRIVYQLGDPSGRKASFQNGIGFDLFDFAVEEIVGATDDIGSVMNRLAVVGNGATGIFILTRSFMRDLHESSDPFLSYGDESMLLFLKRFPITVSDAEKNGLSTTDMVFRVTSGDAGCARLHTKHMPCLVSDAESAEEVLHITRNALEHLSSSNTNSGQHVYSGSNTGLYYKTIHELDGKQTPKKFKTTGKKIEQQLLDPIGKPMH